MANLQGFRAMLTDYVSSGARLPSVVLAQDNEFGQTFGRIVTVDNRQPNESDAQVTGRYIDEICASLADEANAGAIKVFDELCQVFAAKVMDAWKSVGAIRDQAKVLAKEMDAVATELINADDYLTSHCNYGTLKTDFPTFSWGGLNSMGAIQDITKVVNQLAAPTSDAVPADADNRIFSIVIANLQKFVVIKPVDQLSSEDRTALVDAITNATSLTADGANAIVDTLLGLRSFVETYNIIKNVNTSVGKDLFMNILTLDRFLSDMYPVCDGIINDHISVPDPIKEAVKANASALATFCKIAAYYEHMMRTTTFRDSFLLQKGLVNADNWPAFHEAGGSDIMIATFLRKMYGDNVDEIPAIGVSAKAIVEMYSNISQSVQDDIDTVTRQCTLLRSKARVSAFVRVARDFLAKNDLGEYKDISTMIDSKMKAFGLEIAEAIRQYGISYVDASMALIVKAQFPNTFIELLQRKLGIAYLAMVNDGTGEVSETEIQCAEVGVITDLVCEYVVDNFLRLADCKERLVPGDVVKPAVLPEGNTVREEPPIQTPEQQVKDNPSATPATEA